MKLEYININNNYKTVNDVLIKEFGLSTRLLNKLIKNRLIFLNENFCNTKSLLSIGDVVTVKLNLEEDNSNVVPKKIDLDIVYEDEWMLIINKSAGIAIHPSILHYYDSLSNGVRFYFDSIGLKKKIRPANRLDFNTSGLVVFAKCEYIQQCLSKEMLNGTFKKEYICLAEGIFDKKSDTIDLPIARKENSIIERCVSKNGQRSITHYEVLKEFDNFSLVKCILETGRTHQIRVHMSYIGHPLLGDTLYGHPSDLVNRQALHCYKLIFVHPVYKNKLCFCCNIKI